MSTQTLTLAEIRNGTGFERGARFVDASKVPDPLTVAYIALGAKGVLADCDNLPARYGELEFIGECIEHAAMLDALCPADGFNGVWVYEVAEPFGESIALAIIERRDYDAADIARKLVGAHA